MPSREGVMANPPTSFIGFEHVIIILDCTKFSLEKATSLLAHYLTFSDYKGHKTLKLLVGCTPDRLVNYASRLWGGCVSDQHLTSKEPKMNE